MSGFAVGTYDWYAIEGDRKRSAATRDLASLLDLSLVSRFVFEPTRAIVAPRVTIEPGAAPKCLEVTPLGRVILDQPGLLSRISLIRRREGVVGSKTTYETYYLGLHRGEQPTAWVHIAPGRILVTHRSPDAGTR